MNTPTSSVTIKGTVTRVFFTSERFSAGSICCDTTGMCHSFTVPAMIIADQTITLHGRWRTHPKYGLQFDASTVLVDLPIEGAGLAHFLAIHPAAKGIGPAKGQRIADTYGADFERVLLDRPGELAQRFGLKRADVDHLAEVWRDQRATNSAATDLAQFGLTYHQISTVARALGPNAAAIIRQDPYQLVGTVDGLGFATVDRIALQMGVSKHHAGRMRAGLLQLLREAARDGHTWMSGPELIRNGIELLSLDDLGAENVLRAQIEQMVGSGDLIDRAITDEQHPLIPLPIYALPYLAHWEGATAQWVRQVQMLPPEDPRLHTLPIELNSAQRTAADRAFRYRSSIITGGAGSGKTFVVASIVAAALARGWDVRLAAPTGKAARRMAEQVADRGLTAPATTIHRLLGYSPIDGWKHNADHPLHADLVVIDEASMIDAELAYRLTQAIDPQETRVIWVGDPNQLPPVGAGAFLRDILAAQALPTTALTEVMRQAGVLRACSLAILDGTLHPSARDGDDVPQPTTWTVHGRWNEPADTADAVVHLWDQVFRQFDGIDDAELLEAVQILTPTHKGPLGTRFLNERIQECMQGHAAVAEARRRQHRGSQLPLMVGDKIVWTRNDYELELFNGQVGRIVSEATLQEEGGSRQEAIMIAFDDRQVLVPRGKWDRLTHAYAMTVHKAQGSEWPCVVLVCHKSHSFMHHRSWLYTGVTRASRCCYLMGDQWGMRNCAETVKADRRRSLLGLDICHTSAANGAQTAARRPMLTTPLITPAIREAV